MATKLHKIKHKCFLVGDHFLNKKWFFKKWFFFTKIPKQISRKENVTICLFLDCDWSCKKCTPFLIGWTAAIAIEIEPIKTKRENISWMKESENGGWHAKKYFVEYLITFQTFSSVLPAKFPVWRLKGLQVLWKTFFKLAKKKSDCKS